MTIVGQRDASLLTSVRTIAHEIAAEHADDVDRSGRFPSETIDALREVNALSAPIPRALGGDGVELDVLAACCRELGRACGASAMVYAMHLIQLEVLVRHLPPDSWFEDYLGRVVSEQRLIASVTSEVGTGGDMGRSIAAVETVDADSRRFEKNAPTVSYGAHADDLLTTLRRSPEAEEGDQVAVLTHKQQTTLEQTGTWDVLGMRGTCSPGCVVRAEFGAEQVLTDQFAQVAAESMVPISHVLWSHLWLGIAEDAFERARSFVRALARRTAGAPQPAGQRLSHVLSELTMLRAVVDSGLRDFLQLSAEPDREGLSTLTAILRFNNLKLAASEQAVDVCRGALDVCGIVGFKNDTPFSVGRHLRDAMSAPLMITNERIHNNNAGLLLIAKEV
jgi:acyl-CoA dehydrogenase